MRSSAASDGSHAPRGAAGVRPGRRWGAERGQAAVELALCLPVVCLLVLGVVQVGLVVRNRLVVAAAAREGARAAAVSAAPGAAASRAAADRGLSPLEVRTATGAGMVTVTVTYIDRTDVPLIGALIPDVRLQSSASMALEPP